MDVRNIVPREIARVDVDFVQECSYGKGVRNTEQKNCKSKR